MDVEDRVDTWGRWDTLIFHGVYILFIIRCKFSVGKGRLGAVMKQYYFAMARLLYLKKWKDGLCI